VARNESTFSPENVPIAAICYLLDIAYSSGSQFFFVHGTVFLAARNHGTLKFPVSNKT